MGRPTLLEELPEEKMEAMVLSIRAGTWPHIAARAVGIPKSTFFSWMQKGEQGIAPYAAFRDRIEEAHAIARGDAEKWVRVDEPLAWLRYGPGRERKGEEGQGWAGPPEAVSAVPPSGPAVPITNEVVLQILDEVFAEMPAGLKAEVLEWMQAHRLKRLEERTLAAEQEAAKLLPPPPMNGEGAP